MVTIAQIPYVLTQRAVASWLADFTFRGAKPDRTRLATFIAGILLTPKAATATAAAEGGLCSHDALTRLLAGDAQRPTLQGVALALAPRDEGYLVLDDVVFGKEGARFEGCTKLYSPGQKKYVTGFNVVVLGWTDGKRWLPLSFRFWKPPLARTVKGKPGHRAFDGSPYKTKQQLALDLLEWAYQRDFAPTAVLFDSAYLAENVLHWLKAVDWHWVSRMKANRVLRVDGKRFQPKDWAARAEAGEVTSPAKSLVANLRGWGEVRLIGVLPTQRSTEHRFLVGSNPHWTRAVVERLYRYRWGIETGFRTSNQLAGLKDCQARSWRAQENHVALVLLAYCFLETQRQRAESPGDVLDRFRHRPLRADGAVKPAKVRQLKHRRRPKPVAPLHVSPCDLSA